MFAFRWAARPSVLAILIYPSATVRLPVGTVAPVDDVVPTDLSDVVLSLCGNPNGHTVGVAQTLWQTFFRSAAGARLLSKPISQLAAYLDLCLAQLLDFDPLGRFFNRTILDSWPKEWLRCLYKSLERFGVIQIGIDKHFPGVVRLLTYFFQPFNNQVTGLTADGWQFDVCQMVVRNKT